jgi:hypothetical protein
MNAQTFGNGDAQARVEARYADVDWAAEHQAQIERNQAEHYVINGGVRYDVPQEPKTATVTPIKVATDKAISFLIDLSRERFPDVQPIEIRKWAASVHWSEVSAKIDWLKTQPKVFLQATGNSGIGTDTHADIPEGRYAVTGERGQTVFVKVTIGQRAPFEGRTFVNVQAGDELHRVSPTARDALLAKIEADGPEAASRRYGREIGDCGRCGRTLTDEVSRAAGIGPVCAAKGW